MDAGRESGRPNSRSGSPFDPLHIMSPTKRGGMSTTGMMAASGAAGMSIRSQLDAMSLTMHEVVGRTELSGRQVVQLEEVCKLMPLLRPSVPCVKS